MATLKLGRYPLAVLLLIGCMLLASCERGTKEAAPSDAPSYSLPEDEVTLTFYMLGDKKSATDKVWAKVSDYVKGKGLNVRFSVKFIPVNDFKKEMLVLAASGSKWDMNFDADWQSYREMAANGAYMSLNELLPTYAPNLYEKYKALKVLQATEVNGNITALPWTIQMNQRPYAQWRSDLTKKAGIDPTPDSIRTIEDLDVFLHVLKKAFPNAKLTRSLPRDVYMLRDEWVDIGFHGMGFYLNDPNVTILPVEQQPFFLESARMARKWFADGILNKDTGIDTADGATLWKQGNMVFTLQSHEWVSANQGFIDPSFEQESSLLYPDKRYVNRSPVANVVAINRNSEHPDRVLRFLDMLETDRVLYDLVQYGIEGETYVLRGDGSVDYPKGMGTPTSNYMEWGGQWGLWRLQFMRPTPTYGEGFWDREREFAIQSRNVDSPISGLFISEDNIRAELLKRDELINQYGGPLELGTAAGTEQAVEDYVRMQDNDGLKRILAEAQSQVDAYLEHYRKE
ncbi:extracellular solute-binding protein [Cohnella sp. GCM10027633]|uniref:extracellular solute-binding protein n=1 Tax=unclassified Cohnella TaxID=2636738 RepID=UPI003634FF88